MAGLHHLLNRQFYRALRDLRGLNVLLLLVDGSAVFGRLEGIDDSVVNILPAFGVTGVINVRFRPPTPLLAADILLGEMLIDVCNITAAIDGPYLLSPLSKPAATPPTAASSSAAAPQAAVKKNMYRQPVKLVGELQDFVGRNVGVSLIGGWVVGGQLWEVADCMIFIVPGTSSAAPPLITLGALNIFGPPLPSGILSLFGTFRSWINLRTLTSTLYL